MQIPPKEEIRRKGRQMRNREAAKKFRERKKKQIADLEKKGCILSAQNPNAEMADLLERLDQVIKERDKLIKERDQVIEERDQIVRERECWVQLGPSSKQYPSLDLIGPSLSYPTLPEGLSSRVLQREKPETTPQFSTIDCLQPSEFYRNQRNGEDPNSFYSSQCNSDPMYYGQSAWDTNPWG
ncbi:hypothetical protein FOMG_19816 [Fusarium oxysporum f. sp. melonis 26406]|uniref:BZIP domain-containing protein n=1 Tax=Fusarium oxysporum f. sp. melonis 26406 TaxID=1089452 RepID=W9YV02_FUSOX|nr:hypothetical protein FOMG_19816 [Fusarium oxysporum f. sp. melonis 26406]